MGIHPTIASLCLVFLPTSPPKVDAVAEVVTRIDRQFDQDWLESGVQPAARSNDAEYARRVYLDVLGRTPRVPEIRSFLEDKNPAKRAELVDRLLLMPGHSQHFASTLRTDWLPQTNNDNRFIFLGDQFETWLREQSQKNTPVDQMVRNMLAARIGSGTQIRFGFNMGGANGIDPRDALVRNFYEANEFKPEQLAASVSRLFLGVKLECAQCHDHPFAPYSREQFWQLAAFFGDFSPLPPVPPSFVGPLQPQYTKNRIRIPGTEKNVTAVFFNGEFPEWVFEREPREELSQWLTQKQNPFFARNLANRMWARFFGIGLVDPVDEFGDSNPPSHPEVLEILTQAFIDSGFDNRFLIRVITRTRAYQLTSRMSHPSQSDPRLFARMNLKALTGGQIYDSFVSATGYKGQGVQNEDYTDFRSRTPRGLFIKEFPTSNRPTEAQTSILQALMMMNGNAMTNQTTLSSADLLAAVADAPFFTTESRVETLFLAGLSRMPTEIERERLASYIDRGGPSGNKKQALADVFWALLNTTEFLFNH